MCGGGQDWWGSNGGACPLPFSPPTRTSCTVLVCPPRQSSLPARPTSSQRSHLPCLLASHSSQGGAWMARLQLGEGGGNHTRRTVATGGWADGSWWRQGGGSAVRPWLPKEEASPMERELKCCFVPTLACLHSGSGPPCQGMLGDVGSLSVRTGRPCYGLFKYVLSLAHQSCTLPAFLLKSPLRSSLYLPL